MLRRYLSRTLVGGENKFFWIRPSDTTISRWYLAALILRFRGVIQRDIDHFRTNYWYECLVEGKEPVMRRPKQARSFVFESANPTEATTPTSSSRSGVACGSAGSSQRPLHVGPLLPRTDAEPQQADLEGNSDDSFDSQDSLFQALLATDLSVQDPEPVANDNSAVTSPAADRSSSMHADASLMLESTVRCRSGVCHCVCKFRCCCKFKGHSSRRWCRSWRARQTRSNRQVGCWSQ